MSVRRRTQGFYRIQTPAHTILLIPSGRGGCWVQWICLGGFRSERAAHVSLWNVDSRTLKSLRSHSTCHLTSSLPQFNYSLICMCIIYTYNVTTTVYTIKIHKNTQRAKAWPTVASLEVCKHLCRILRRLLLLLPLLLGLLHRTTLPPMSGALILPHGLGCHTRLWSMCQGRSSWTPPCGHTTASRTEADAERTLVPARPNNAMKPIWKAMEVLLRIHTAEQLHMPKPPRISLFQGGWSCGVSTRSSPQERRGPEGGSCCCCSPLDKEKAK